MIKLHNTDAVKWAREYDGPLFHALLCDTPYHLTTITKRFGKKNSKAAKHGKDGAFGRLSKGFMGNTWDGGDLAFKPETWEAFMRVLHPGAFGMAFAASRNWHRMAVAIEDSGFIIHPTIFLWAYSSGFPKATNIQKQLDKGQESEVIGEKKLWGHNAGSGAGSFSKGKYEGQTGITRTEPIYAPASELSAAWQGHRYGLQALKPAVEPIIVFQKPYQGRPLDNITQTGAGALNIDAGRIGPYETVHSVGRWPSNFVLGDEEAAARLNTQTGELKSGKFEDHHEVNSEWPLHGGKSLSLSSATYGDSGGASRFFYNVQNELDAADPVYYCAKASPSEKEAGLHKWSFGHAVQSGGGQNAVKRGESEYQGEGGLGLNKVKHVSNPHPTVKPLDLCRYLASLLLPPQIYSPRRIFIPFSGVGSECIGAHLAGWDDIHGVEFDTENGYIEIAEKRIEYWTSRPFTGKGV